MIALQTHVNLLLTYHEKFPSHGYRWLNAKIYLDLGLTLSAGYVHKCCRIAGIRSKAKRRRYRKPGHKDRLFPNLLLAGLKIEGPCECIVSDMTVLYVEGDVFELTLYMDLWNNEIIAHSLSAKRGDRMTYLNGLQGVLEFKQKYPDQELVIHSDQGAVYASKAFNELLPMYGIQRSMSRAGTPTDNAAMESIIGWIKEEMFLDLHIDSKENIVEQVDDYIRFFNEERPAYALNFLTPKQYREKYGKEGIHPKILSQRPAATPEGGCLDCKQQDWLY